MESDSALPLVSFEIDGETVRVCDELEEMEIEVVTGGHVGVQSALPERFPFPVDEAISLRTSSLRIEDHTNALLRNERGDIVSEFGTDPMTVDRRSHLVEVSAPMKAYLLIDDVELTAQYREFDWSGNPLEIDLSERTRVTIGARSNHTRPRGTITVPDDPERLMEALPVLASSIAEFSPERSWGTLRGHPPRIEVADELAVPDAFDRPQTGVTLSVPPTFEALYAVAPPMYYLGADLERGEPALHLSTGYSEPLAEGSRSLAESADRLFDRFFLLDSIVRIGGYTDYERSEYDAVAGELPFYPPALRDRSLSTQLMEYLEVGWETLAPYVPDRPLLATLTPRAGDAELLPFLLDSLARVRVDDAGVPPDPKAVDNAIAVGTARGDPGDGVARLERAGFEHRLERRTGEMESATVSYVVDSPERAKQLGQAVSDSAFVDGLLEERVTVVERPTADTLADVLETESALAICDLPVSDGAFVCQDGPCDPAELSVRTTFTAVNGAGAVPVAAETVGAGAVAALVTDRPLPSERQIDLTEILLSGHVLASSVDFAGLGDETAYRFVGDPTQSMVQPLGGLAPNSVEIERVDADEYRVRTSLDLTDLWGPGSVAQPMSDHLGDTYKLVGRTVQEPTTVSARVVAELLEDPISVVSFGGETVHGVGDVSVEFVRRLSCGGPPEER